MSNREYIKNEIDTLPDSVLDKVEEFIAFQKYSLRVVEGDKTAFHDLQAVSMSSTSFWDNPDDDVWDNV